MRQRSGGPHAVRSLGLAVLLGLGACATRPRRAETRGPFLSIALEDGEGEGGSADRARFDPGSVALALGGLPPGEVRRLREVLSDAADEAMRRAAPELFDLGGTGETDEALDPLRGARVDLPALTAAANVLGSPWRAAGISVQVGPACAPAAARCSPLFAPAPDPRDADAVLRRGRALAWALGRAVRLRATDEARPALLRALREAQARPASTLALVFDAGRGTLDPAELDELHQLARRALSRLEGEGPQRSWLAALSEARGDWELPIALGADEVLVVPRLSSLARLQDFALEVRRAAPQSGMW